MGKDNSVYSYYLILLGGTGARCGEIFVHMCANGYFEGSSIRMLYIDSDEDNGNAQAFRKLVELYGDCRRRYHNNASPIPCFFQTDITLRTVNPVTEKMIFRDIANLGQTDVADIRAANALMRALYSDEECATKISDGFFARPNVGAALFSAKIDEIMSELLRDIYISQQDLKKVKIFMIGSLFGGTGASSLPTISRYLKRKLYAESTDQLIGDKLKIGGCMALPYFSFCREKQKNETDADDVEIEANKFATKTRSALEYYKKVDSDPEHKTFDSLYFLGHDGHDVRGVYSTGGSGQRNMPHIVEFYAAMAAVTFFKTSAEGRFFAVVPESGIAWNDFYRNKWCFFHFYVMMRFSVVLHSLILEELFDYMDSNKLRKKAKNIPWYYDFLDGKDKSKDSNKNKDFDASKLFDYFKSISSYCSEYVRWFAELNLKGIGEQTDSSLREQISRMGKEDSRVDYLSLFSPEILFRQYINDMIRTGRPVDYIEHKKEYDAKYRKNLRYIREHFQSLEKRNVFTDLDTGRITIEDIWTRLSDLGYRNLLLKENLFKDIAQAESKTMAEGVKNLLNAVYVACMF